MLSKVPPLLPRAARRPAPRPMPKALAAVAARSRPRLACPQLAGLAQGVNPISTELASLFQIGQSIFEGACAFAGGALHDNASLLTVRRNGSMTDKGDGRRRVGAFTQTIQTAGGSEFEAEFSTQAHLCYRHCRIARPYRKNEQSFIEIFNRTVRSEFLGWAKYHRQELPELA